MSALEVPITEQDEELRTIANRIREIEQERGHTRTVLIGDLNANPEDPRVYSATGLHAVPQRLEARRGARIVKFVSYPYFYNPMTRFASQQAPLPSGTYHWRKAIHHYRPWNTFDQVLIRPELLKHFDDENVTILVDDGSTSFQKKNAAPNPNVASDHFPILVSFNYPGA